MSYRRTSLGDLSETVRTAFDVADDPYLPEVVCRIQQLKHIDRGEAPGVCSNTPAGMLGGVGIRNAVPALRAYVYAQQHPWVYAAGAAAVIGIPMLIGYHLGRTSK